MKWFDEWKNARKSKQLVLKKIDAAIEQAGSESDSFEVVDPKSGKRTKANVSELMDMRRKAKLNGVDAGEVLKIVANVAIVAVIVLVETGYVLNAKASRFIKTL